MNDKSDYKHEVYLKIIKDPDGFFRQGKRIGTVYENFLSVYHIYVSLYTFVLKLFYVKKS